MSSALRAGVRVVACAALAALAACSDHHGPAAAGGGPASEKAVDSLIVSVEDVRRIADFEGLSPYANADLRYPARGDANAPGPCQAVGSSEVTFATGWRQYRAVAYNGTTDDLLPGGVAPINEVSHAVAVYADAGAALSALERLETTLNECAALHHSSYTFTLNKPDPAVLRLSSPGWSHLYRVKSSVLMSVGVVGIEPTEQVADTVAQTIVDRIT